jgi:hypothetical protein
MGNFSLDVKSLKIGDVAVDGGPATVLVSPGDVRADTIKIAQADGTKTSFKAAGKSQPVLVVTEDGEITLEYDLMTFDPEVMADYMGGTVSGVAPNKLWNKPEKAPIIEKTHEIIDGQGVTWLMPRVQISAALVGNFSATDVNVIRVKGTVLQPTKADVSAVIYGTPV